MPQALAGLRTLSPVPLASAIGNSPAARLTINLGHICHTFGAVHRLEVDITSSNFPRRARNTNSGHPILANDSEAPRRVVL